MRNISNRAIVLSLIFLSVIVLVSAIFLHNLDLSFFLGLIFNDAKEFRETGSITSDFMPVGYSGFLGACMKIVGTGGVPFCQASIYVAAIFAAFLFLNFLGVRGLLLALGVLVVAIHPMFLLNIWRIHDGNLTIFLLLGFLASGAAYLRFKNLWAAIFLGVFAGLLFTVRINTALIVVPAFLLLYFGAQKEKRECAKGVTLFIVFAAIMFMGVNMVTKQKPLFLPDHGFYNLFSGANEYSAKYLLKDFSGENSHREALEARGFSSVETFESRLAFPPEKYGELAMEYIKNNPFEYVKLIGIKIFTFFRPGYHMPPDFNLISVAGLKWFLKIFLALPFLIWIFSLYKTKSGFFDSGNIFTFLVIILYTAPFFFVNADPRYRFPVDIIFLVDAFCRMGKFYGTKIEHA